MRSDRGPGRPKMVVSFEPVGPCTVCGRPTVMPSGRHRGCDPLDELGPDQLELVFAEPLARCAACGGACDELLDAVLGESWIHLCAECAVGDV